MHVIPHHHPSPMRPPSLHACGRSASSHLGPPSSHASAPLAIEPLLFTIARQPLPLPGQVTFSQPSSLHHGHGPVLLQLVHHGLQLRVILHALHGGLNLDGHTGARNVLWACSNGVMHGAHVCFGKAEGPPFNRSPSGPRLADSSCPCTRGPALGVLHPLSPLPCLAGSPCPCMRGPASTSSSGPCWGRTASGGRGPAQVRRRRGCKICRWNEELKHR